MVAQQMFGNNNVGLLLNECLHFSISS